MCLYLRMGIPQNTDSQTLIPKHLFPKPFHSPNLSMDIAIRQQQNIQDNAHSIACLVKFCTDVNIGTLPGTKYLLKSVVCNMQYIQKDVLYSQLFGSNSYVNWEISENILRRSMNKRRTNSIGGVNTWYYLLMYVGANSEAFQQQTNSTRTVYKPFYIVLDACKQEFVGTSISIDLSTAVRIFLMIHLIGIQPVHAICAVLTPIVSTHLNQVSASYAQNMALKILEEKFTPSQYIDTVTWLVNSGIMLENSVVLQREVDFQHEKQQKSSDFMKMQVMQASRTCRPSLISLAKTRNKQMCGGRVGSINHQHNVSASSSSGGVCENTAVSNVGGNFDGYYTFEGFNQFMKFPSNFSPLMQKRAYWLASQWNFDWKLYVKDFLPPKDLSASLLVCFLAFLFPCFLVSLLSCFLAFFQTPNHPFPPCHLLLPGLQIDPLCI
jgi:hypothetical protein